MIKPDFHIQHGNIELEDIMQCRLLMEMNTNSFSYVLLNVKGMRPMAVKYFQWSPSKLGSLEEVLREIVYEDEILTTPSIDEIFLVYNFPESNLVPERFYDNATNKTLTELIYGDLNNELVLSEKIPWWELHNVYRIPKGVHNLMQQKFSSGKYWHFYSLQLKCHKMFTSKEAPQYLKTFFYTDKMIVMICKGGQLQLIQTFAYQDSKDAAYNLLNCCEQLHLKQEEVVVDLAGLIERKSALHEELQKYFLNISFDHMDDSIKVTDELREYPLHYFSSLLKMAICV
ncbi:MAG TPA: DUF3822 family protein [Puia sp.]|nr:DUF3822 family protein [Puia sp.]